MTAKPITIDQEYLLSILMKLLRIPSPAGYTDAIVRFVGQELESLGISYELTRRGAIRADLNGKVSAPARAIVAHLDTLGAMVKSLKPNGRLEIVPIGTWSSRFAEGCRVTIFTDHENSRGTILPLKASGHTFNDEVDTQPVKWEQVEVRIDEESSTLEDLQRLGFHVGDFIAIDPQTEILPNGYINSRHLDNKAGVAVLLATAKACIEQKAALPIDAHLLFTISEEVGSGASVNLHGDIAEMVSIDNSTPAPGQNSTEHAVTIAIMDSSGPFDYHLTHTLLDLCQDQRIAHCRDVFRYYRCDAASAIEAGNDIRTALICFGADSSHGYERTHLKSLLALSKLISVYLQSDPVVTRDRQKMGSLQGFPSQPSTLFDEANVKE